MLSKQVWLVFKGRRGVVDTTPQKLTIGDNLPNSARQLHAVAVPRLGSARRLAGLTYLRLQRRRQLWFRLRLIDTAPFSC